MGLTLDGVNGISATGNIISSQGFISATGNIYAGNIIATIASSTVSVIGNITGGNIIATNNMLATGNMLANGTMSSTGAATHASLTLGTPLLVTNGGTGATSLAANNVLLGNGVSTLQGVAPGTSGYALRSNGSTWAGAKLGLGMTGEVWNDVSGSRSQGVTYTNSRSYPIQVQGNFGCNGGGQGQIYIDGALVSYWAAQFNGCGGFSVNMPCIIPAGSTYLLAAMAGGFRSWFELY